MTRSKLSMVTALPLFMLALACSDDGATASASGEGTESESSASDSDAASDTDSDSAEVGSESMTTMSGDGDGDPDTETDTDPATDTDPTTGDGDGDTGTGDGDGDTGTGDGDGDTGTGDGDGDTGTGDGDGDTGTGDGDGDTGTGDGDGDTGTGDGDGDTGTGDGDGDMGTGDGDGDQEPLPPAWLLSIDNPSKMLQKVDIFTGETEDLCQLNTNNSYPSLTFSRANTLYASRSGQALDIIDPCTCEITPVGDYGVWTGVNGITADNGVDLRGIASTQDETIEIDTQDGMAGLIGALGINFGTTGATWTDEFDGMWAINGNDDWLYQVDVETGMASQHVQLNYNFGTVGIEISAFNGVIYACSSAGDLLSVDPDTGMVEIIGDMGNAGSCTNLAAPFEPVGCIDNP